MEIVIYARRTENWSKFDIKSYSNKLLKNNSFRDEPKIKFLKKIEIWEKIYGLTYFEYREALKKISLESWGKTNLEIVNYQNCPNDKNIIVIPSDDDDWFAPNIKDIVEEGFYETNKDLIVWKGLILKSQKETTLFSNDSMFFPYVLSNSYACRNNISKNFINKHTSIKPEFSKEIESENPSVYNKHHGNYWRLSHTDDPLTKFDNSHTPNVINPTKRPQWMEEHIIKLQKIHSSMFSYYEKIKI